MNCPKCGFEEPDGLIDCLRCGVIFSRLRGSSLPPTPSCGRRGARCSPIAAFRPTCPPPRTSRISPRRPGFPPSPRRAEAIRAATALEAISFTREQLDIYGIHELQVLEDLLRRNDQGTLSFSVLAAVADKIKRKIDWPAEQWQVQAQPFLTAFYRAQRGRLEQRLLFGERKESKKGWRAPLQHRHESATLSPSHSN